MKDKNAPKTESHSKPEPIRRSLGKAVETIIEDSPNRILEEFDVSFVQPRLIRYADGDGNLVWAAVERIVYQGALFTSIQRSTHGEEERGNNVIIHVKPAKMEGDEPVRLAHDEDDKFRIDATEIGEGELEPMVGRIYWSFRSGVSEDALVVLSWGARNHFPQQTYDVTDPVTKKITGNRQAIDWTSETGNAGWEQYILAPLNNFKQFNEEDQNMINSWIAGFVNTTQNAPSKVKEREAAEKAGRGTVVNPVTTAAAQAPTGGQALAAAAAADED